MSHPWTGKVFIATSLDGFIARENGDLDWLIHPRPGTHIAQTAPEDRVVADFDEHMTGVDAMVMGRGTYETVATFDEWPYGEVPVIVLSTTLDKGIDARVTVVRSQAAAIAELDRISSKGAYLDGGQVIQAFLREGQVADLVLTRVPVLLGTGLPLFGSLDADVLFDHLGTDVLADGMISSHYRRR